MNKPLSIGDTTCGDLALLVRPLLRKSLNVFGILVATGAAWMALNQARDLSAFLLISVGSLLPWYAWTTARRPGLPLAPILGIQTLLFYATPVLVQNPVLGQHSHEAIVAVALEVFLFGLAVMLGWMFATRSFTYADRPSYHRFSFLGGEGSARLASLGPVLLGCSMAFLLFNQLRLLQVVIPGNAFSLVRAIADAAGTGGGLLGGYFASVGALRGVLRTLFWTFLVMHCLLTIYNYTLFPATSLLIAMLIGSFLGRGRLPVVPLVLIALLFSFFNLSKFEMRKRYWIEGAAYAAQELSDLPTRMTEWAELSWRSLTVEVDPADLELAPEKQSLSDRVNNLANLLEAREAMVTHGVKPYGGGSYTIIPVLLIPRLVWPDKPRTHEGMVALNVHFGRQTREDSLVTYISWGLLPEAYANFGPLIGALLCGLFLGAGAGALEFWGRPFPFTSLEALIFLSLSVQIGTSFEMVASVWLTSIFQMIVALICGTIFFVRKYRAPKPVSS
jgi:hypothetical protein